MADITEVEQWDEGVYQLETTDPVQGGAEGVDNLPHKHLANRTKWLREELTKKAPANGDETKPFKVAQGMEDNEAISKAQMEDKVKLAIPTATIIIFPVSTVPDGFLECNGASLSRTTYANLYQKMGNTYGAGNGSTTFNIPDLRGEFIRGWDHSRGADSGRGIGSYQGDTFRSHRHYSYGGSNSNGGNTGGYGDGGTQRAPTSYEGSGETRPRNRAIMFCIKY